MPGGTDRRKNIDAMNNIPCRKVFTDTLLEEAEKDRDIIVVTTDARGSVTLTDFAGRLPGQFVELGIAEQNAIGVSAGGVSVGGSLADAVITPDIETYIGGGSVTAGQDQGITLRSYHNYDLNGTPLDKRADAYATAPGGALIGGNGADAEAIQSPKLQTYVGSDAALTAGADITLESRAYNEANAKSEGITGGGQGEPVDPYPSLSPVVGGLTW